MFSLWNFLFKAEVQSKIVAKTSSDPVYWLDRLASVFRNLNINIKKNEQHPCQSAITFTWPCLSMTLDKFQTDRRVMERCCRCLRFALRLIGHQSAPLLQPLVTQVEFYFLIHSGVHRLISRVFCLLDGASVQLSSSLLLSLFGKYSGWRIRVGEGLYRRSHLDAWSAAATHLPAFTRTARFLPQSGHSRWSFPSIRSFPSTQSCLIPPEPCVTSRFWLCHAGGCTRSQRCKCQCYAVSFRVDP